MSPYRRKIFNKCKDLKTKGKIKDVATKNGDVVVLVEKKKMVKVDAEENGENGDVGKDGSDSEEKKVVVLEKMVVVTDTEFENLLRMTKGLSDEREKAMNI